MPDSSRVIYRASEFSDNTIWNYPLKKVEIVTDESTYMVCIYDVGFAPPYYDATIMRNIDGNGGLDDAQRALNEKGISSSCWNKVDYPFLTECNAIMTPDNRKALDPSWFGISNVNICPANADKLVDMLLEHEGESASMHVYFKANEDLLSFKEDVYVMMRDARRYERRGFVGKNGISELSLLFEIENGLRFSLYDQQARRFLQTGKAVALSINFVTSDLHIELDGDRMDIK